MHFSLGVSAVTLNGGCTHHRILPAHEGQHAIRWFIHNPHAIFAKGDNLQILREWINSALAGLERVNPFISELENLNVYNGDNDIALHLQYSESDPSAEIAAIISLAPAALPTRRKLVIRKKGADAPVFLDLFSPFVEPLHYLLLLPYGTLGWAPNRLNATGNKFSQAHWYRTRFFMNTEQLSVFSRLTGEYLVDAWTADDEEYIGTGDEEPADDPTFLIASLFARRLDPLPSSSHLPPILAGQK
ncbi:hypothetical protein B0H10DRAFT_2234067 [Mycena sp. CBHHK59/15]|nr:hypothetical protein B0H10DRAFT_2234067 [Mycena sp. CBHHK59/15]